MFNIRHVIVILLLILPNVALGANFTFLYKNAQTKEHITKDFLIIYRCDSEGELKEMVIDKFSGNSYNITFEIPDGNSFREYHATESGCYLPQIITRTRAYQANAIGYKYFEQADSCKVPISNLQVQQPVTINQETEIKATIDSPIANKYPDGKNTFVPEKLKRFFETDVTVQLLINNNIANSTEIAVPLSGKEVKFVYKFPQEGSYDITIKTIPTDCKCKSADETEVTLSVNVQAPAPEIKNCSDGTPIS